MAAVDLATKEDLAEVLAELRRLRAELERLHARRPGGELLTLPEAARRLKKSLRTVERWAKNGQLQVVPIGGARYVRLPGDGEQR
jgi:excisionase family DNA binding protein